MDGFVHPRDDPRRTQNLVPHIVDYLASTQPDGLLAEYPVSATSYEAGYRKINYGQFANAVNGLAYWMRHTLGTPRKEHEIVAYMGPNDLRYPALVVAAVKAGFVMFLTSPRNSVAAQKALLGQLDCTTLLTPSPRLPQVTAISDAHSVRVAEVPDVEELLSQQFEHFEYTETYAEALDKPFLVVHTSGSTGFPKPLTYTHRSAPRNTRQMSLEPPEGFLSVQRKFEGKRFFMTFPPFHAAAFVMTLYNCLPFGTVFITPIAGAIPSAEGLVEGLKKSPADIAFIVPSIILELAQNPELLDYCAKHLEFIMYCGGDLPQEIGDIVASKVELVNQFGATELGICSLLHHKDHDPRDWRYVQFHPEDGHVFRPSVDDTYELCIVRNEKFEAQQPTFTVFPDIDEYRSRDLFVKHPTKPDLWRWKARADDILVFLNGEKTNPVTMEHHIVARNPEVTAALVIGAQRFQAALLLEVNMGQELSIEERAAAIERFWPSIEEANHECPTHAKIAKTHILFVSREKPLLRTGKGTIPRSGNLSQYAKEIDELYENADRISAALSETEDAIDLNDTHEVLQYIRNTVTSTTEWKSFNDEDNFFHLGMDSLQGLVIVRRLRQSLNLPNLALSTIYTNPTVNSLALAIINLTYHQVASKERIAVAAVSERQTTLEKYKSMIEPTPSTYPREANSNGQVIMLTGSTGALGAYILVRLLSDPTVSHVYCLNRSIESVYRQAERNKSLHLSTEFPSSRVTFLTVNLAMPSFDLPFKTYSMLLENTTLIIHSAWPVNFNIPLSAFEPSIHGLVSLINFAGSSKLKAHLHFLSSISSVMSPSTSAGSLVPEAVVLSPAPLINSYAESKHISELLLDYAQTKYDLSLSFSRVGQVAGAVDAPGLWNPSEWFPSLVLSSLHLAALPGSLGSMDRIDWIPIDKLADTIIEITKSSSSRSTRELGVFHLVNPHATTWATLRPWVQNALEDAAKQQIEIILAREWIELVKEDMDSGVRQGEVSIEKLTNMLNKNPAAKLIEFYQGILGLKEDDLRKEVILDTVKSQEQSEGLKNLVVLEETWVRKWIREWIENASHLRSGN